MRKIKTENDLVEMLVQATRTDRRLPSVIRTGSRTYWPDITRDEWLAYADPTTRVRVQPTSSDIDEYYLVIILLLRLPVDDRRLVWLRSKGQSWKRVARKFRKDQRTIKKIFYAAVRLLFLYVNKK